MMVKLASLTLDTYDFAQEACRPFFRDGSNTGKPSTMPPNSSVAANQNQAGSESSGFTSFFTTTKSESNHTHSEGSSSEPADSAIQGKKVHREASSTNEEAAGKMQAERNDAGSDVDWSDSSMAVLARVKRKHKSSSNSDNSNDSRRTGSGNQAEKTAKRVRIEAAALNNARKHHPQAEPTKSQQCKQPAAGQVEVELLRRTGNSSYTMSSLSQSLSSSGSDSGGRPTKKEGNESCNAEGVNNTGEKQIATEASANMLPTKQKPSAVTSSSSGTNTGNIGSSGSGTGSSNENNTTGKSLSGGSGNYVNSNSEEHDVAGERDRTGWSNECEEGGDSGTARLALDVQTKSSTQRVVAHAKTENSLIHDHKHGDQHEPQNENIKEPPGKESMTDPKHAAENTHQEDTPKPMTSKNKIMEKKRKRMSARRWV